MNTALSSSWLGRNGYSKKKRGRFLACLLAIAGVAVWLGASSTGWGTGSGKEHVSGAAAPAASAQPPTVPAPPGGAADTSGGFQLADVELAAKKLAEQAYQSQDDKVPAFLKSLTKAQWNAIRFQPDHSLWNNEGLAFEARFYHPGFIYTNVVDINVVENGKSAKLAFSPDMFKCDDKALAEKLAASPAGFAGFSLCLSQGLRESPDGRKDPEEIAIFLGASYFQSRGRNSRFGVFARGLAVNTAAADGEEFPYFREFWLVKPKADDESFFVYALLDSPSVTGAYQIKITPGTSTVMEVEGKLFKRQAAKPGLKLGMAPLTSMFLFSETGGCKPGDYRPEVHNSDGLLYRSGDSNWFWNPLTNPDRLLVTTFPMTTPRGFGLMQRDDNFDHYQDIDTRFDRHPSLWVEPKGDWGPGRVELVKIPGTEDYQGNIVAYWVPDSPKPPQAAADGKPVADTAQALQPYHTFAYSLYWMTPGATPHELGKVVATRMVRSTQDDTVQFIVDFEGEDLNALPADTGLTSIVETPDQTTLQEKRLEKNPVTGGWRLFMKFKVQREGMVQTLLSARDGLPPLRFSVLLKKGENLPNPLTETWVFDLIQ